MNYLLSNEGLETLRSSVNSNYLFAFDFTGTLAKVASKPTEVMFSSLTHRLLADVTKVVPIAVISSRNIKEISKFRIPEAHIFGNYGLEQIVQDPTELKKINEICEHWKATLRLSTWEPGVEFEDKVYSITIHYKRSITKLQTVDLIWKAVAKLTPSPKISKGKSQITLQPACFPNKSTILLNTVEKLKAGGVFYVGDDDSDEEIFKLSSPSLIGCRVGQKEGSRANYYVAQYEVNQLLKTLREL